MKWGSGFSAPLKSSAYSKYIALLPRKVDVSDRIGYAQISIGDGRTRTDRRMHVPKTTKGTIPLDRPAFVYVGEDGAGWVKIGMSTEPERRCRSLGMSMVLAHPVVPSSAKEVETEAFRAMGHNIDDREHFKASTTQAVNAVLCARDLVGRRMHADPDLTVEEARQLRLRMVR